MRLLCDPTLLGKTAELAVTIIEANGVTRVATGKLGAPIQGVVLPPPSNAGLSALALKCRSSPTVTASLRTWLGEAAWYRNYTSFCYNGRTVSQWSGHTNGWCAKWAKIYGCRWQGDLSEKFIPYTLGRYYPGGIHHRTHGNFTITAWGTLGLPNSYWQPLVAYWGHYDGSADWRVY